MTDESKLADVIAALKKASLANRTHVLPGMIAAYDEAGPAVLLDLTQAAAAMWVDEGYPVEDLFTMLQSVTRKRA